MLRVLHLQQSCIARVVVFSGPKLEVDGSTPVGVQLLRISSSIARATFMSPESMNVSGGEGGERVDEMKGRGQRAVGERRGDDILYY